jgi:glycosyltransferase involved in cell wall biosynthesis
MRIAVVAPAWFAVPPTRYGGIEWVVAILADGLVESGHDVTLFAAGDSQTKARLVTSYDEPPSMRIGLSLPDLHHALTCYARAGEFDVINDHSGPLGGALGAAVDQAAVCHTVHGPLTGEPGDVYALLGQLGPKVGLISVSDSQRSPLPDLNWLATCHNAIALDAYPYNAEKEGYLLFLGRMSPDKGAHHAVRLARETGLPLILAGKMHDVEERHHFESEVEPYLGNGIEYVGEVSHDEKVRLLQRAMATVFPIQWPEPFGLVMVESMACGTPVLATRYGAVPEVIEEGRSGVIVDSPDEMPAALEAVIRLDPAECRRSADERFSASRMVADYVRAYERLLEGRSGAG